MNIEVIGKAPLRAPVYERNIARMLYTVGDQSIAFNQMGVVSLGALKFWTPELISQEGALQILRSKTGRYSRLFLGDHQISKRSLWLVHRASLVDGQWRIKFTPSKLGGVLVNPEIPRVEYCPDFQDITAVERDEMLRRIATKPIRHGLEDYVY